MSQRFEPAERDQRIGTVLVALQFLLIAALASGAAYALMHRPAPGLAWGAAVAGLLLGGWALTANRPGNFNIRPAPRPGATLVRSGPYRFIRHPMYSAVLLCGLAAALMIGNWPGWLLAAALAAVLDLKARLEERWLALAHPDYAAYRAHGKRFVPLLW